MSTIYIIDDIASQRLITSTMLKGAGFSTIMTGSTAQDLFNYIDQQQDQTYLELDLVLLDINLPDMNGIEVCQKLKSNLLAQHIPIIMVSASLETEDMQAAFEAGAMDFITKPVNKYELIARVRSAIRIKQETDLLQSQQTELLELTNYLEVANKALIEQHKQTEYMVHTIHEIGNAVHTTTEIGTSLYIFIKTVNTCIAYDAAELCMYDEQQQLLTLRIAANPLYTQTYKPHDIIYDPQRGFIKLLLETQQGLLVADITSFNKATLDSQQEWQGIQPKSYIGIPLIFDTKILGTIELIRQHEIFTEQDLYFLQGLAYQVSGTLVHMQEIQAQQEHIQHYLKNLTMDIDQEQKLRQVNSIINGHTFQSVVRKAQTIRDRKIDFDIPNKF